MHWQPCASWCFSGLFVVFLCNFGVIISDESNRRTFILPPLTLMHYTLYEVIILPENTTEVEVTLVSTSSMEEMATIKMTPENEFRLGNSYNIDNISMELGLQVITSCRTTLLIEFSSGLLRLPATEDFAINYYSFPSNFSSDNDKERHLFILTLAANTTVNVCNFGIDRIVENVSKFGSKFKMTNCTRHKLNAFETLLLNNVSDKHVIEITSDHPTAVLEGHVSRDTLFFNKEEFLNISLTSWNVLTPSTRWSNQFVLIPSAGMLEVDFLIMSLKNTSVTIQSDDDVIDYHLLAMTQSKINTSCQPGRFIIITGTEPFTLDCINQDERSCRNDLFPLILPYMENNKYSGENSSENYTWTYLKNDTKVVIVCTQSMNISLYSSIKIIESIEETGFNIGSVYLKMKAYEVSDTGLYKFVIKNTFDRCEISYLNNYGYDYSKQRKGHHKNASLYFALIPEMLNTTIYNSAVSENVVTSGNLTGTTTSISDSGVDQVTLDTLLVNINTTDDDSDNEERNKSASLFAKDEPGVSVIETDVKSFDSYKTKENDNNDKNNNVHVNFDKKTTKGTNRDNTNKRFRAVVDIVKSKDGSINKLSATSDQRNNPKYSYTFDINENYALEDGKNPVAIIVSLVSAILAVGAIILIYLLKEFFSQRQQMRKTRIRPFVSYY